MLARQTKVRSALGCEFDCYVVSPDPGRPVPAVVLASTIRGVDHDLRAIADRLASCGCIAAAPDLFWRTVPGPLARGDPRAAERAQPRIERIAAGEQDLVDVLQELRRHRSFDGRAAVIGFCYGGPYAILGPKRLGYRAGMSCHGSQMLHYVTEIEGMERPVCLMWGGQDHFAPANVRDAYRAVAARMTNVVVHVLAGVQHGYTMRGNAAAFDGAAYEAFLERAMAMLQSM